MGLRKMTLWFMLVGGLCLGCGPAETSTTDTAEAEPDSASVDAEDVGGAEVDAGPAKSLKWTELVPDTPHKLRAVAAVPGKVGVYVVVGESSTVLWYEDDTFKDISPKDIGTVHLNAVWAESADSVVVAGEGSTLITWDGSSWQVAGSVPPVPVVNFHAVHGASGGEAWAVGEAGEVWRRKDGVWLSQSVTVSEGAAPSEGADFVGVQRAPGGELFVLANKAATSDGGVLMRSADGGQTWSGTATQLTPHELWLDPASEADDPRVYIVGGTTDAFAVVLKQGELESVGDVQWSLGLRAVAGVDAKDVWLGGLKGQVRRWQGAAWEVVKVAPPPGTVAGFPQPSADVLSIALHGAEERMLLTGYKLYRFGTQP